VVLTLRGTIGGWSAINNLKKKRQNSSELKLGILMQQIGLAQTKEHCTQNKNHQ